jgi:hypothetical protein
LRAILRGDLHDRLGLARKSAQSASGLLLHITPHISLIQCLIPAFFCAPRAAVCLTCGGSFRSGRVMRWDRDGSKTSTRRPRPSVHSGMADVVQAFDMIQAFMRLIAASHLRGAGALNEPVLPLPVLAHRKP